MDPDAVLGRYGLTPTEVAALKEGDFRSLKGKLTQDEVRQLVWLASDPAANQMIMAPWPWPWKW